MTSKTVRAKSAKAEEALERFRSRMAEAQPEAETPVIETALPPDISAAQAANASVDPNLLGIINSLQSAQGRMLKGEIAGVLLITLSMDGSVTRPMWVQGGAEVLTMMTGLVTEAQGNLLSASANLRAHGQRMAAEQKAQAEAQAGTSTKQ